MQEKRQTNEARTAAMRAKLLGAGRKLFADQGFADTGTPQIVAEAQVTRGALYHHFADKTALFRAVVEAEAAQVDAEIRKNAGKGDNPMAAGTAAFFAAMSAPGRARILLRDGPAVLGQVDMDAIDAGAGRASLADGIKTARADLSENEVTRLATVLSAAYDRAALAVADGGDAKDWAATMMQMVNAALKSG